MVLNPVDSSCLEQLASKGLIPTMINSNYHHLMFSVDKTAPKVDFWPCLGLVLTLMLDLLTSKSNHFIVVPGCSKLWIWWNLRKWSSGLWNIMPTNFLRTNTRSHRHTTWKHASQCLMAVEAQIPSEYHNCCLYYSADILMHSMFRPVWQSCTALLFVHANNFPPV